MLKRSKRTKFFALAVPVCVALAACGGSDAPAAPLAETTSTFAPGSAISYKSYGDYGDATAKDVAGPCSYQEIDKKNYAGKTLNVITHAVPVMGEPTVLHAKQFGELTGAEVKVVNVPFGELFQKIQTPLQTGQNAYDVMFYPSLWIGDFNRYLAKVPQKYLDTPAMKDVTRNYLDVATWNNEILQFPVDGDRHYLKYRTDVFDDPAQQKAYQAATGKKLEIPDTWEDYNAVAAFFSKKDWDGDGKPNFGSAEVTKRDDLMFSAFISRAAAHAKNPNVQGGFFFDLETMEPLINTPGFVRGLEQFVAAQGSFPPGGSSFGLGDEIFSFGGGQTLMSYTWDDSFVQAQQKDSPIRNKVGAAPLPGATEVWNRKTNSWDKPAQPNVAPYVTWGWTSAVTKASKEQDMAFDFLCFFSTEANTELDLQVGRFGVNPYRTSHYDAALYSDRLGWDKKVAAGYVKTLSEMDDSQNRVFDLRVPGVNEFMSSMANGVAEALAKQKPPQKALDDVAVEWKRIVERIGKDDMRAAYGNVVKLEDNK